MPPIQIKIKGESVTVEQILRKGAEKIDVDLKDQPEVQTVIMMHLGEIHRRLGLLEESEDVV